MKLLAGMVFSSVKAPSVYNEIVGFFKDGKKKMVEVSQFSANEDDKTVIFTEQEIRYMLSRGSAVIVNNWQSRN